ncbi:neprilysin-like 16 isoform X2 [Musca autumnalis]|uniref:neprilysin-like 16 isoform X2 n=1 Tax=Musca autumnalis TaxID=221902 RepID=UPI003CED0745
MTTGNTYSGVHSSILQKQMSFKSSVGQSQFSKFDDLEVIESGNNETAPSLGNKNSALSCICCIPCSWIRSSATVHKIAITAATLLVTSLLVASPILFLISTAPSQLPRDCHLEENNCIGVTAAPPECSEEICKIAAHNIHVNLNWNFKPCTEFKNFSCPNTSNNVSRINVARSAQETVDFQMRNLLQHNTTSGAFRKLGRLYGSCLRQTTYSPSVKLLLNQLGGYLPIGAVGPSNISELISKINELGPSPIVDVYFDLSYGKRPHTIIIVSAPRASSPILENKVRWAGPKAPPYRLKQVLPKLLPNILETFLPIGLSNEQRASEKEDITSFIKEIIKIRVEHSKGGFWESTVIYNVSSMVEMYPFVNWALLIPNNWSGPIVVRSSEYLNAINGLLTKYSTRVAHNSIVALFVLGILPQDQSSPIICTQATMWALPDMSSALFIAQYSTKDIKDVIKRTDFMFKSLKAYLKRAPSLKGAALVKLSALKVQSDLWNGFLNISMLSSSLQSVEISSDNWIDNVLNIYKRKLIIPTDMNLNLESHQTWAYPTVAKTFYDTLSHSIVVPLSVILRPYFAEQLPPYLQYATVGVVIAKEILRSITKSFEEKAMRCVPKSVNIFSNYSRMDVLIHSGGMQISYHSMLSLTGPMKGMPRLPGLNLTPTQIFFLVSAQELCADSQYAGINTEAPEFEHILGWLVAQGGSASEVYRCPIGSMINAQKTCNIL